MRVSADQHDRGFRPDFRLFDVIFNGANLQYVQTADEEEGLAIILERNENGDVAVQDGRIKLKELRGKVELRRRGENQANTEPQKIDLSLPGCPKFILQYNGRLTREMSDRITAAWRNAYENGEPVVLDSSVKIFAVNANGEWALLDSSAVIP